MVDIVSRHFAIGGSAHALVRVVSEGGFSAGAKRLGIAKSAVSRRIRDLEDRLGARLFDRTKRRIQLTEAGRALHERAVALLAALAPAEGQFLERHPDVSLSIILTTEWFTWFGMVLISQSVLPRCRVRHFARRLVIIRHACVASPALLEHLGTPQKPDDLSRFPEVVYSNREEASYWKFANDVVPSVNTRLEFANGDAVREAAIAGLGVAMLPTFIVHDAVRSGALSIVLAKHMRPPIAMYAVHPSTRHQSARARAFIDFLVDKFRGEPPWDRELLGDGTADELST